MVLPDLLGAVLRNRLRSVVCLERETFMTENDVLQIGRTALTIALELALPILLFSLVTGVLVSIFQAVTQIQEFTLTFVPKLLAIVTALALFGPWMMITLIHFIAYCFNHAAPSTR